MPAGPTERLVAGAALLTIPDWLVHDRHRSQNRDVLQTKDEVRQVGDRAVPVLEIKGVEKLLGALLAQLLDRLQHALIRARVLRQRVRLNFWRHPDHGIDPSRATCPLSLWERASAAGRVRKRADQRPRSQSARSGHQAARCRL